MPIVKTYMELPYQGADGFDSDFVSAFGYLEVSNDEIGFYLLARQFHDNCGDCACDLDYYNPAFLTANNEFSETGIDGAKALRDCVQLFATMDEIKQKVQEVQHSNLHKNNDLLIYQIVSDHPDNFVNLNAVQIIKESKV